MNAQQPYDSITISKCSIGENWYGGKWTDTLKSGKYKSYISDETTAWRKGTDPQTAYLIKLISQIKENGTEDVAKCFIPRHSMNFYKGGKIIRYMLICFECDGVRFSDDPAATFVKSTEKREKQMNELRLLYLDKIKVSN